MWKALWVTSFNPHNNIMRKIILEMRKLKFRKGLQIAQGHRSSR